MAGASESTDERAVGSNFALQATYDVDQLGLGADVLIDYVPRAQVPTSSHGSGAQIAPELFAPDRPSVVVVYDQQLEVVVNQLDDRPAVRYVAGNDDFIVRWHDGFGDFDVRVGRISSSHLEFAIAHVGDEDTVIQTNLAAAGAEGETQAQQG